jgi:hypothetical protein
MACGELLPVVWGDKTDPLGNSDVIYDLSDERVHRLMTL